MRHRFRPPVACGAPGRSRHVRLPLRRRSAPPANRWRPSRRPTLSIGEDADALCRASADPSRASRPQSPAVPSLGPSLGGVLARGRGSPWELTSRECALGVALAAEEHRPASAAATDELALAAVGAGHAGLLLGLLDVLAVRVAGAAHERAEPPAPPRELLAALRAHLAFEELELRLLLPLQRLGVIARARRQGIALLALLEAGA